MRHRHGRPEVALTVGLFFVFVLMFSIRSSPRSPAFAEDVAPVATRAHCWHTQPSFSVYPEGGRPPDRDVCCLCGAARSVQRWDEQDPAHGPWAWVTRRAERVVVPSKNLSCPGLVPLPAPALIASTTNGVWVGGGIRILRADDR